jgi:hypothetical protein
LAGAAAAPPVRASAASAGTVPATMAIAAQHITAANTKNFLRHRSVTIRFTRMSDPFCWPSRRANWLSLQGNSPQVVPDPVSYLRGYINSAGSGGSGASW